MSHLRPADRVLLQRTSCRRGRHRYGAAQQVGGGIVRQVCDGCGAVTIDLTGVNDNDGDRPSARGGGRTGI